MARHPPVPELYRTCSVVFRLWNTRPVLTLPILQYDGVNGVTECPIAPGQQKTYTWVAEQYDEFLGFASGPHPMLTFDCTQQLVPQPSYVSSTAEHSGSALMSSQRTVRRWCFRRNQHPWPGHRRGETVIVAHCQPFNSTNALHYSTTLTSGRSRSPTGSIRLRTR